MRLCQALVVGVTVALAACNTPEPATIRYTASPQATAVPEPACTLTVRSIRDARRDRTTLGIVGGRVIRAPTDTEDWIRQLLGRLRDEGVGLTFAASPVSETISGFSAEVQLMSAWAESVATSRIATVVVAARYEKDGVLAKQASYRGSVTEINWWNSSDEMQAMIEACLSQILVAMRRDLTVLCQASRP